MDIKITHTCNHFTCASISTSINAFICFMVLTWSTGVIDDSVCYGYQGIIVGHIVEVEVLLVASNAPTFLLVDGADTDGEYLSKGSNWGNTLGHFCLFYELLKISVVALCEITMTPHNGKMRNSSCDFLQQNDMFLTISHLLFMLRSGVRFHGFSKIIS